LIKKVGTFVTLVAKQWLDWLAGNGVGHTNKVNY